MLLSDASVFSIAGDLANVVVVWSVAFDGRGRSRARSAAIAIHVATIEYPTKTQIKARSRATSKSEYDSPDGLNSRSATS